MGGWMGECGRMMDEWMGGGWMSDGWMGGWMDGKVDGWVDGWVGNLCAREWMDR